MILAADIGGTKTNIALFEPDPTARRPKLICEASFASKEQVGLEEIIEQFFAAHPHQSPRSIQAAGIGVAGPIIDDRCQIPNLPWSIDGRRLRERFAISRLALLNDLEATAEGISTLTEDELCTLNEGAVASDGLKCGAVIAAGTGLGMAILSPVGGEWIPIASEGGHADFAPRNPLEMDLLRFLLERHRRVSVERVVSGPGIFALYEFFRTRPGAMPLASLRERIDAEPDEAPALISEAALDGSCPVCKQALDLFISIYGASAGNLGLLAISSGGMYVGGGIAPKILPAIQRGGFRAAFVNKGRLSPLLERMPLRVILNPNTALLGAAHCAQRLLRARAA
jgi:glucokinase